MLATLMTGNGQPGLLLGACERRLPRPPQLELNSRKSSGFLCLSRPPLICLTLGILAHSQVSRFGKVS